MADYEEIEYRVFIKTDRQTGKPTHELWKLNNRSQDIHRLGGPAMSTWHRETGALLKASFYQYGRFHNDDDAAHITYDPLSGERLSEQWCHHGANHRDDDKPAFWMKDPDTGVVFHEEYWKNGFLDRANAPAVIWRDKQTGNITGEEFYRNGEEVDVSAKSLDTLDP